MSKRVTRSHLLPPTRTHSTKLCRAEAANFTIQKINKATMNDDESGDAQCPSWAVSLGYLGVASAVCLSNWGSAVSFWKRNESFVFRVARGRLAFEPSEKRFFKSFCVLSHHLTHALFSPSTVGHLEIRCEPCSYRYPSSQVYYEECHPSSHGGRYVQ
jgi:hypothetical protein